MSVYSAQVGARIVEAAIWVIPDEGVDIYQALIDAQLRGFASITVHDDNTATVVLYSEGEI